MIKAADQSALRRLSEAALPMSLERYDPSVDVFGWVVGLYGAANLEWQSSN
jgi:hypothetical protein